MLVQGSAGPVDLGGATARAVLGYLLVHCGSGVRTEGIINAVWGGPGQATRDSVYHYLSRLRRALRAVGVDLQSRRPQYRLMVDPDQVDWHRFRSLAGQARRAREARDLDRAAGLLRAALALWEGPPLADVGERLAGLRRELADHRGLAVEALASVELERGYPGEAVSLLRDEHSDGPVRERTTALLIDALTASGRREEAGEIYRRTRDRLIEEQGIEPGPDLAAAHRRALGGEPSPAGMVQSPRLGRPAPATRVNPTPISGLPRLDQHFTGRSHQLAAIVQALGTGRGPALCALFGMGGCGKTALAVRAAHALSPRFPDGIVFLNLRGYTEDRTALTAAEAVDRLLRRMRVAGAMIPADPDERTALYQDLLASRRMLLVFDNARDTAQIDPLLPVAGASAAVVTSRRRLAALDDALTISLDVLDRDEATRLFRTVAGERRIREEPQAEATLARLIELCGRLPLALRIAAGRYRVSDQDSLADLADRLSHEDARLGELEDDDRSVVASFRVSVRALPERLARTFALLSANPGTDFDLLATAALLDVETREAARQLGHLADRYLIIEPARGRYRFHDLVVTFARQYALSTLPGAERIAALRRLFDYYLRAAAMADSLITPHRHRIALAALDRRVALPQLAGYDAAVAWFAAEQDNLADGCVAAGAEGFDVVCWQLAYTLRGYFFLTKSWQPWQLTHDAALAAARRCGDVRAQAMIINNLGLAKLESGDPGAAEECYRQARRLFATAADPHGETTARGNSAWLLFEAGRFAEFVAAMRPVLEFYREMGSERNAAITLRGIGLAESFLGLTSESIVHLRAALEVFTSLGSPLDIAMTWNALGEVHQRCGEAARASEAFAMALASAAEAGSGYERARARHRLGQLALAGGDLAAAQRYLEAAVLGYENLGAPEAGPARQDLSRLTGGR